MERPKNFASFFCDVNIFFHPRHYFLGVLSWKIVFLVLILELSIFSLSVWALISPDTAGQAEPRTGRARLGSPMQKMLMAVTQELFCILLL